MAAPGGDVDVDVDLEAGHQSPTMASSPRRGTSQAGTLADQSAVPSASVVAARHGSSRIKYPPQFVMVVLCTAFVASFWMVDFFTNTNPALHEAELQHVEGSSGGKCHYSDHQIKQSCNTIIVCFGLVVVTRMVLSVACIGRAVEASLDGQQGPFSRYAWSTIVHGPLFIFAANSLLFWAQLLAAEETCSDIHLLRIFRLFASYSSLMALLCCLITFWHTLIVGEALRRRIREGRRAPTRFIETMPTVPYDPELFGEDGRRYHAECPICLGEFGPEDEIKVTHCGHAFHKECLGRWLGQERTCALCRRDVTQQVVLVAAERAEEAAAPASSASTEAEVEVGRALEGGPPPNLRQAA